MHVFFSPPDLKRDKEQGRGLLHSPVIITLKEMRCKADLEPATNAERHQLVSYLAVYVAQCLTLKTP